MSHTRATVFRIDSTEKLPSGALRVRGRLTKTGVFDYSFNGETIREARQDSEVFNEASLDTLKGLPVTVLHPSQFVGTENWGLLSVGHVTDAAAAPPYVDGEMLIFDEKTIAKVESGELVEISMGYTMKAEDAPKDADFDFAQTTIRYNHAALGPEGWGRLGSDVALRLDSKHDLIFEDFIMERTDANSEEIVEQPEGTEPEATTVEIEDAETGEPIEAPAEPEAAEATPVEETEDEGEAPAGVTLDTLKTMLDGMGEILSRLSDSMAPTEEKTDSAPVDVDALVSERVDRALKVRASHAKICPDAHQDGRSNRELCLEALARVDSDVDEAASDEVLEAAAEAAAAATPEAGPSLSEKLLGHAPTMGDTGLANKLMSREQN